MTPIGPPGGKPLTLTRSIPSTPWPKALASDHAAPYRPRQSSIGKHRFCTVQIGRQVSIFLTRKQGGFPIDGISCPKYRAITCPAKDEVLVLESR